MRRQIAIITGEYFPRIGGISTYVDNVARAAREAGHDVKVVAPLYAEQEDDVRTQESAFGVERIAINTAARKGIGRDTLQTAYAIGRHLRRNRYDIVHFANDRTFEIAGVLRRLMRLDYICTVHGTDILKSAASNRSKLLQPFSPGGPRRIFANSRFTGELLSEKFPNFPRERITVAPLGVNPFWFAPASGRAAVRAAIGAQEGDIVALAVARLETRKGHDLVLRAMAKLPELLKRHMVFVSVGPTIEQTYVNELDRLMEQEKLRFVRRGALTMEEVRDHYAAADFVCLPGRSSKTSVEGLGLVFLEAAAQGIPCIGTRLGGIPEAILHERTGLVIAPDNVEALRDAMQAIAESPHMRSRFGAEAITFAGGFTWARCAEITYADF